MNEELKQLIEKNLPAMAAGEMKKYLEQAEIDKKALEAAKATVESQTRTISLLTTENNTLKANREAVESRKIAVEAREKAADTKERDLKVAELTYMLEQSKQVKLDLFALVNTFVANPRAIELIARQQYNTIGSDYHNGATTRFVQGEIEKSVSEKVETKGPQPSPSGLNPY